MRNSLNKKPSEVFPRVSNWVQGLDLNQRPSGYEPLLAALHQQQLNPEIGQSLAESLGTGPLPHVPCYLAFQERKGGFNGARN